MPLDRAEGAPTIQIEGIYFPMKTAEGTPVSCLCTSEALQDGLAGLDLEQGEWQEVFEANRSTIEEIASGLYDGGQLRPIVRTQDVI